MTQYLSDYLSDLFQIWIMYSVQTPGHFELEW